MAGDEPISATHDPKAVGPRLVCERLPNEPGATATVDAEQARHARRVLRLSGGDSVQLLDGRGMIAQATLIGEDPRGTACRIESIRHVPPTKPTLELATAIPKGPRGDAMINDLAQLGVDTLIPLTTARSVVDPKPAKLVRFAKAAAEAAKQSGRAWFMQVAETHVFDEAIACDAGLKLVADPYAQPLSDLPKRLDSVSAVRLLIGPEGGLTDDESAQARDAGFTPWRYNTNVLRIETAAIAAAAILRAHA